jgi:ubiquinol-cytochrome c reductase cytochrome b subunit
MLRATTDVMVNVLAASCDRRRVFGLREAPARGRQDRGGSARWCDRAAEDLRRQVLGVVVMGGAVIILFFLPWLDHSPAKSIRYRPSWHKTVYACSWCSSRAGLPRHPAAHRDRHADRADRHLFYFGFFLLMPWWSRLGTFKPVPSRVTSPAH